MRFILLTLVLVTLKFQLLHLKHLLVLELVWEQVPLSLMRLLQVRLQEQLQELRNGMQ